MFRRLVDAVALLRILLVEIDGNGLLIEWSMTPT